MIETDSPGDGFGRQKISLEGLIRRRAGNVTCLSEMENVKEERF